MKHPIDELDMNYFRVNGLFCLQTKTKKIKKLTSNRCKGTGKIECVDTIKKYLSCPPIEHLLYPCITEIILSSC